VNNLCDRAAAALTAAGILVTRLRGDTAASRDAASADTMHSFKSLEYRCVATIDVSDGVLPNPKAVTAVEVDRLQHNADLLAEWCLLFVACTRARDGLVRVMERPGERLPAGERGRAIQPTPPPGVGAQPDFRNGTPEHHSVSVISIFYIPPKLIPETICSIGSWIDPKYILLNFSRNPPIPLSSFILVSNFIEWEFFGKSLQAAPKGIKRRINKAHISRILVTFHDNTRGRIEQNLPERPSESKMN
jgi:hypothetical protein